MFVFAQAELLWPLLWDGFAEGRRVGRLPHLKDQDLGLPCQNFTQVSTGSGRKMSQGTAFSRRSGAKDRGRVLRHRCADIMRQRDVTCCLVMKISDHSALYRLGGLHRACDENVKRSTTSQSPATLFSLGGCMSKISCANANLSRAYSRPQVHSL